LKCIIVGNGNIEDTSILTENISEGDFTICCDGGLRHTFNEGIMPSIAIGDFDSVSPQILDFYEKRGVRIEKYPPEKDFTDLELAIKFAVGLEPEEILIFGCIGTRIDHTFAAMNTLMRAESAGVRGYIMDNHNKIALIKDRIYIHGKRGDLVSLMPFTEEVQGITTKGLKYELDNFNMKIGVSLGVSNELIGDTAEISLKKGYLFVMQSKD
jgi:thiamine pyrophosphokinase